MEKFNYIECITISRVLVKKEDHKIVSCSAGSSGDFTFIHKEIICNDGVSIQIVDITIIQRDI